MGVAFTSASFEVALVPPEFDTGEAGLVGMSLIRAFSVAEFRAVQGTDGSAHATSWVLD